MRRRIGYAALGIVAAIGVFAQAALARAGGLVGVLDPATGAFRVLPAAAPAGAPVTNPSFSGTVVVNYSATNVSKVAATTKLSCALTVVIIDESSATGAVDQISYSSPATVSPSAVTCTVKAPYLVSVSATSIVELAFTVTPATVGSTSNVLVSQALNIGAFTIPANGTTTTKNLATSI